MAIGHRQGSTGVDCPRSRPVGRPRHLGMTQARPQALGDGHRGTERIGSAAEGAGTPADRPRGGGGGRRRWSGGPRHLGRSSDGTAPGHTVARYRRGVHYWRCRARHSPGGSCVPGRPGTLGQLGAGARSSGLSRGPSRHAKTPARGGTWRRRRPWDVAPKGDVSQLLDDSSTPFVLACLR